MSSSIVPAERSERSAEDMFDGGELVPKTNSTQQNILDTGETTRYKRKYYVSHAKIQRLLLEETRLKLFDYPQLTSKW